MARNPYSDYLRAFPFWLMDIGPADSASLPLLTPTFGFATITSPEVQFETHEVIDGNALFNTTVIKRGRWSNITLTQGITFFNNDFERWMSIAISGDTAPPDFIGITGPLPIGGPTYRRDLLLIQYFAHINFQLKRLGDSVNAASLAAGAALATGAIAAAGILGSRGTAASLALGVGTVAAASAMGNAKVGPIEFAARVPARAWMLRGCVPVRYKSGTDFDGSSSAVTIAEIELAVDLVDEYSLGSGLAYGAPILASF